MFVHDFNCGWMKHPFLNTSTQVKNEKTIEKIISCGIRDLYIDTDKGTDVGDAPTAEEVKEEIHKEIINVAASIEVIYGSYFEKTAKYKVKPKSIKKLNN